MQSTHPGKWRVTPMYSFVHRHLIWKVWRPNALCPMVGVAFTSVASAHDWIIRKCKENYAKNPKS